jgi:hypothetical protein
MLAGCIYPASLHGHFYQEYPVIKPVCLLSESL